MIQIASFCLYQLIFILVRIVVLIESNYTQKFDELNNDGFDFANGYICRDVHKFEKSNSLSKNIIELNFYQYQWKNKLVTIEIGGNLSEMVFDLKIYKNRYVLVKKLHLTIGTHLCRYICKRCLSCYAIRNVLVKRKERCEQQKIGAINTSNKSLLY